MAEKTAAARRRGRPQRLPEDTNALSSGVVGCNQRIAWLMTVARTLGPDPELARRDGFIAALRCKGITVDSSRVSRWESGLQPLPGRVTATYEDVLGLPEGALVSVAAGLRRAFEPGPAVRDHPTGEVAPVNQEIESLLDRAEQSAATGAHWLRLADRLDHYDRVFLREREWVQVTQQLVRELGRATGLGYVRRYEAAAAFVRHPDARRYLLLALGRYVTDPDAQVVAPVLNLLTEVPDPAASALTLRLLSADCENVQLRRAASSVAAVKLARGHFDADALERLEPHVIGALRRGDSLDGRLDAFDLAVRLPEESWARIAPALRTRRAYFMVEQAREHDELISPTRAARSSPSWPPPSRPTHRPTTRRSPT